ncbi:hypothetical protein WG68_14175 [Arsukibacterium ikkense]|uniref:Uncharacterized protein n=1 Tax=Arsukibacterium ikkense TaxID=336831 RepID=A0A0M2V2Y9_9GAMM|nr:hypothetical protein WG68_14175 [Arsukibacterium ikkense]
MTACEPGGQATAPAASVRELPIAAAEVKPRDLSRRLTLSAEVRARQTVRLTARTRGMVEQILVEEGDAVQAGQLLLELEQSEQRAELARATALLKQAELAYQRQAELYQRNLSSAAEYQAQAAALRVAESEQQLWLTRVAFGRVYAPRAAVVSHRAVELGEAVREQELMFELAGMDELVVNFGVSERDVAQLAVGQALSLQLDAMPAVEWAGRIRRIFPAADLVSRFVTVEVALPTDAYNKGVKPGFLARVNLVIDARQQALAVPVSAVLLDDNQHYVLLVQDNLLVRQRVEVGVERGQWQEIIAGLVAGDIVMANASIDMQPGQAVRIVGWRG